MTTEEILAKEGVKHYDKDIRQMTTKELKANFAASSSGKIIVAKVIKNIVWQVYEWVKADQEQVGGWLVAKTYQNQLNSQGILDISFANLIIPENYTPQEIDLYKYPLPTDQRSMTLNQKWIEQGGGINGQMYGMEADSMPRSRIRSLVKKEIEKITANL